MRTKNLTNRYLIVLILLSIVNLCQTKSVDEDSDIFPQQQSELFSTTNEPEQRTEFMSQDYSKLSNQTHKFSKAYDYWLVQKRVDDMIGFHHQKINEQGVVQHPANLSNLKRVLKNNKEWTKQKTRKDSEFFKRHQHYQKPTYLWIGCSDSRMPANQILGLDYGQVFVLRNVANIVSPSDISSLAVIQYAVQVLQVKDIIVAGHYGCGGIKAAIKKYNHGPLQAWLSKLRRIRHKHASAFVSITSIEEKARLLVQINVKQQVFNVASTPFVQQAWKRGQQLNVHGLVYEMQTGRLIDLHTTIHSIEQLPEQLAIIE